MFTCETCAKEFDLPQHVLDRYPGWTPRQCLSCRDRPQTSGKGGGSGGGGDKGGGGRASVSKYRDLTIAEVLATFRDGPQTGVFTDGASEGNPGPGGWGAVLVADGRVIKEDYGSDAHTTNNRMELTGMIAGLKMVPPDTPIDVYTDSKLVVDTLTQWAEKWKANGWVRRESKPIANLELVKEAYGLAKALPLARINWIRAHSGNRWNEYADSLATAYRRSIF